MLAEFTDPSQADLLFKDRFEKFQNRCLEKLGWPLFKRLSQEDIHCFESLRIPLTAEQSEFDTQVLALAKLLIDSLNEDELENHIRHTEPNLKGIGKFERFLAASSAAGYEPHITFLRTLQELRSTGSAHRKGAKYEKAAMRLSIHDKDSREVFTELLRRATDLLAYLEAEFLGTLGAK
jgi:hypothetical protein